MHPLERFLPLLVDGDTPASMLDLTPDALVVDPIVGPMAEPILHYFMASRHMWMTARSARHEHVRTLVCDGRGVVEDVLHLKLGAHDYALPVALVGETGEGGRLTRVRIYHSMLALKGHHEVRQPLLHPDESLRAAPPVSTYLEALAAGDVSGMLALFADDAVVREPTGGPHTHRGAEARRAYYQAALAEGGVRLDACSVTDDGSACAVEYIAVKWGPRWLTPQPGLVVFERATPTTLAAVRIYDDVDPQGPEARVEEY
jgi:hypothetical protein